MNMFDFYVKLATLIVALVALIGLVVRHVYQTRKVREEYFDFMKRAYEASEGKLLSEFELEVMREQVNKAVNEDFDKVAAFLKNERKGRAR